MPSNTPASASRLTDITSQPVPSTGPVPYTFIEIIDADHLSINRLASKIRKILSSDQVNTKLPELNSLLFEITWRLVRHDFSEDMVMRPAFAAVLGNDGKKMVEQDRADHARGRDMLLEIIKQVQVGGNGNIAKVTEMLTEAFDELGEHMKVESGEVLPRFENIIPMEMSMRLAREYADTLVMTPSLTMGTIKGTQKQPDAVFPDGAHSYVHTTPAEFKQIYSKLRRVAESETGAAWLDVLKDDELKRIDIDRKLQKRPVVPSRGSEKQNEVRYSGKSKIPTNALGLPVVWSNPHRGKL